MPEVKALGDRLDAMLPGVRITELLHEVARGTGFLDAFTNFRTDEACPNENALLAAILADANLGLGRMAEASQGVTRDQLVWTAEAYIREETYKGALARIIDAHHALPISAIGTEPRHRRHRLVEFGLPRRRRGPPARRRRAAAAENLLAHTSPVGWEHIAVSGDFLWDRAAAASADRRALRLGRQPRRAA